MIAGVSLETRPARTMFLKTLRAKTANLERHTERKRDEVSFIR